MFLAFGNLGDVVFSGDFDVLDGLGFCVSLLILCFWGFLLALNFGFWFWLDCLCLIVSCGLLQHCVCCFGFGFVGFCF